MPWKRPPFFWGIVSLSLFVLLTGSASAREVQAPPVEITGFGDLWYVGGQDRFQLGQVEIDLDTPLDDRIDLGIALALDDGVFTTGSFTVDFHLLGKEGSHFRSAQGIDHSGLIVGQFDVPFGLDWQVFPSIDRKLVSGPIVIENTHDFWNDFGVQAYLESGRFNAVAYGVNGFGYDEVEMNLCLGGRTGFRPVEQIEIGSSYAGFFDQDYDYDMDLIGMDAQFKYRNFSAKGEFLIHRMGLDRDEDVTNTGFYLQGMYVFGNRFLVSRFGQFRPDEGKDLTRVSIGGGWVIAEGCEARLEQQINTEAEDLTLMQLVAAF